MTVPVVDAETAVSHPERLPLFHNRFANAYAELYGGVRQLPWADELRLGLTGFTLDRDRNYGSTMEQAFGGITEGMSSIVPTLKYRKDFVGRRLKTEQFFACNTLHTYVTDTVRGRYDWRGAFTPVPSRMGEITVDGALLRLRYANFVSRTNLSFALHRQHTLELNAVYTAVTRTGANPRDVQYRQTGIDPLTDPAVLNKWVAAFGIKSYFLEERLSGSLFAKYFNTHAAGTQTTHVSTYATEHRHDIHRQGAGGALKYAFSPHTFVRLSGESAVRLPEQDEFFGDESFILSNFALLPERSHNINLGLRTGRPELFSAECNIFYRRTFDMILLISTGLVAQYRNVDRVKGVGVELDGRYSPLPWLALSGNLTFQDFRLFGQDDPTYEGARLRNTPFFFANMGLETDFRNALRPSDRLAAYWRFGFVREYYLNYIPRRNEPSGWLGLWGDPKVNVGSVTIPDQCLHTIGCSWWTPDRRLSFGLEIKNLFDADVFDNYRIQNAGRSFHLKTSLHL